MLSVLASPLGLLSDSALTHARRQISAQDNQDNVVEVTVTHELAHGHGRNLCSCEGLEADHPFTIDCSDIKPVNDAVAFLEENCDEGREDSFEWGASFLTPDESYKWVSQAKTKAGVKAWADPTMLLVGILDAGTSVDELFSLRDQANTLMDDTANCPAVETGGTLPKPTAEGWCRTLTFPTDVNTDFIATMDTAGVDITALFTNHGPTEFEESIHFFMEDVPDADLGKEATVANEPIAQSDQYCKIQANADGLLQCQQAFFILQSHHDFCTHDTLTRYDEEFMHMWEKKCTTCAIERQYQEGLKNCPQIDCSDTSVIDAAYYVLSGKINDVKVSTDGICIPASFDFAFEWGGSFNTPDPSYQWVSQAAKDCDPNGEDPPEIPCNADETANGFKFADPQMKMLIYSVETTRMGALFNSQDGADKAIEHASCSDIIVYNGGTFPFPTAEGVCFTIVFPTDPTVNFIATIPTSGITMISLWAEHMPTEFEGGSGTDIHYFQPAGIPESQMSEETAVEAVSQVPMDTGGGHDHGRRLSTSASPLSMKQIAANKAFAARRQSRRHLSDPGECCTNPAQIGAWKSVVAYHDLCNYDDVPGYVELGFHDYEQACANYFCNAVGPNYAGDVCPSPPSPPPPASKTELSTGAIVGIAVAAAFAVLFMLVVCVLIAKERSGTPIFAKIADVKKDYPSATA